MRGGDSVRGPLVTVPGVLQARRAPESTAQGLPFSQELSSRALPAGQSLVGGPPGDCGGLGEAPPEWNSGTRFWEIGQEAA